MSYCRREMIGTPAQRESLSLIQIIKAVIDKLNQSSDSRLGYFRTGAIMAEAVARSASE
jgi:hypothetical protein